MSKGRGTEASCYDIKTSSFIQRKSTKEPEVPKNKQPEKQHCMSATTLKSPDLLLPTK